MRGEEALGEGKLGGVVGHIAYTSCFIDDIVHSRIGCPLPKRACLYMFVTMPLCCTAIRSVDVGASSCHIANCDWEERVGRVEARLRTGKRRCVEQISLPPHLTASQEFSNVIIEDDGQRCCMMVNPLFLPGTCAAGVRSEGEASCRAILFKGLSCTLQRATRFPLP